MLKDRLIPIRTLGEAF